MTKKKLKLGLPTTIKVGAQPYKIIIEKNLKHPDVSSNLYGYCSRGKEKTIYLDVSDENSCVLTDTLLHEILHAIWEESAMTGFTKVNEEQCVTITATWLTMVMSQNPKLKAYFNKHWK